MARRKKIRTGYIIEWSNSVNDDIYYEGTNGTASYGFSCRPYSTKAEREDIAQNFINLISKVIAPATVTATIVRVDRYKQGNCYTDKYTYIEA